MTAGIYAIKNLINGRIYVGSSVNMEIRWVQHKSLLKGGNHHSERLQYDWDEHKEENFVCEVVLVVNSEEHLAAEEQRVINAWQSYLPEYGYNTSRVVTRNSKDLSKEKPWNLSRSKVQAVASYYEQEGYTQYADRLNNCSQILDFRSYFESDNETPDLKILSAKFCRVRYCPMCQWRRSLMWKAKTYKILPKIIETFPKYRWFFITFTLKNCHITNLKEVLNHMNKSFKRLTDLKAFPGRGWIKSVEVTQGQDGTSAHPHIHCLLMTPSSYVSGRNYISCTKWREMWGQCLRVDYSPVVDVQVIDTRNSSLDLIPQIVRYLTKENRLVDDPSWFLEFHRQTHKTKAITTGGILKSYFSEQEQDENWDQQTEDEHTYSTWNQETNQYNTLL